ncbi:MAG TPA: IPTL-CTERM sorting domain-containing protein [Xanthomonadales bacterium]|nr:IPTL-CTERM sorting domain-containing protein [Xanthomonadales bacterium]
MNWFESLVTALLLLVNLPVLAGAVDVDYQVTEIPYNLRDISESGFEIVLSDEEVSNPLPIRFAFDFYGDFYTAAYISSNGFITFDAGSSPGCCSGMPIPTPGGIDNMVAGFWEDLNPSNGGTIRYQTLGTPPDREFVVGFYQVEHFRGNSPVEMEMILHEGTGIVELQYATATTAGESNHSVGVESEGGQYGTQVDYGSTFSFTNEARLLTPNDVDGEPKAVARFAVEKEFNDDNPVEVEVVISCNTGLPLQQASIISEGDGVVFIVTDFIEGELNCNITEASDSEGYQTFYSPDGGVTYPGGASCEYLEVSFGEANSCLIRNELERVLVDVTKWWIDENSQFDAVNFAEADYECENEQFDADVFGSLEFLGDGATDGFFVFPRWDGTTTCTVSETLVEGGIDVDDSECLSLSVAPGNGASCSIYNTRLYEGIPTLSRYGRALMALLMLGVGLVTFRRVA